MYKKVSLNGNWKIQPSNSKPGIFKHKINVPSLVDIASPKFNWQDYDYFWYQTTFKLKQMTANQVVSLQLEQVMFGTEIWLNDKKVGEDIPCYTSQEFILNEFIIPESENMLVIRVGKKETLPEHSAVGNDFEKISWIPGIWGDVWIHIYEECRIKWTQAISDIDKGTVKIHSEVENFTNQNKEWQLIYEIKENQNKDNTISNWYEIINCPANSITDPKCEIPIPNFKLWKTENPFLYELTIKLRNKKNILYQENLRFGMRKFEIKDEQFYLNNKRKVLLGGNIAFHRLLSDENRGILPWQEDWIKKVLIDIPKEHNMFFFRIHLGHAYNKWYDIADEYGILLHDEWMFWTVTGSKDQIKKELKAWVRENCNHPSIIIWDALNECTDEYITDSIIPDLKKLDTTRPWEMVDFPEDHPYIYSLGPVLIDKKFGYSRSIFDLQKSNKPTMVNEYLWWWLDSEFNVSLLTEKVVERWLGKAELSPELLSDRQCFLAAELTELWRRLDIDAIMPFVYLSTDGGPTANWFQGLLEKAEPKPLLKSLKNAFSPVGVSIELWDRHFLQHEKRDIKIFIFNDTGLEQNVTLNLQLENSTQKLLFTGTYKISAGEHKEIYASCTFSFEPGEYKLIARLYDDKKDELAFSQKILFLFKSVSIPETHLIPNMALIDADPNRDISNLLKNHHIEFEKDLNKIDNLHLIILNLNVEKNFYKDNLNILNKFVKKGGALILQEPEYSVKDSATLNVLQDLDLNINYREDKEEGGYDSYVFPENLKDILWHNLESEHFQMFNGALGGEIVSQYDVFPSIPYKTLAKCHLNLKIPSVMEINYGSGKVIISRIQIRGRLIPEKSDHELYSRRYDPVAEQYFWNLLTSFSKNNVESL